MDVVFQSWGGDEPAAPTTPAPTQAAAPDQSDVQFLSWGESKEYPKTIAGAIQKQWDNPSKLSLIGLAKGAWSGMTLPRDVMTGQTPLYGEDGKFSDEVIRRGMDFAGVPYMGATGMPSRLRQLATGAVPSATPTPTPSVGRPRPDEIATAATDLGVQVPRIVASDSLPKQQVAAALSNSPIAGSPIVKNVNRAVDQLGAAATSAAEMAGTVNPVVSGGNAGSNIQNYITNLSRRAESVPHEAVRDMVNPAATVPLNSTQSMINTINLRRQAAARGPSEAATSLEAAVSRPGGLTYEGVKDLRSSFGPRVQRDLVAAKGMDQAEVKQLYGALSQDLRNTVGETGGPAAIGAWEAANTQSRLMNAQRQALSKIVGAKGDASPEMVFERLAGLAGSGSRADVQKLALARSAAGDAWGDVSASIAGRMGRNNKGDFSPELYLRDFQKMPPASQQILFSPEHRKALTDINTVSRAISEKVNKLGNPSGTARSAIGATELGAAATEIMAYGVPVKTLTTILGARIVSNMLARPITAQAAAKWSQAYALSLKYPGGKSGAIMYMANRQLASALARETGRDVSSFMRQLTGPIPSRSDDER